MKKYVLLLRGINVGGKSTVSMAELKVCLEELGCHSVRTYINSGNVLLRSNASPKDLAANIQRTVAAKFALDARAFKVLLLTQEQLEDAVASKPKGFGEEPKKYHSDVIFLIGVDETEAMAVFKPREGVDKIWRGRGVIFSQRLSEQRTKSRLNRIMESPLYKSMTIRTWGTTTKLLALIQSEDK